MSKEKKQLPVRWQLIINNFIIVLILLIIISSLTLNYFIKFAEKQLESQIHTVAYMLSETEIVIETLEKNEESEDLNNYIDSLIDGNTDIDIITIADMTGKRVYHLNKSRIGKNFVGNDDTRVYLGENYVSKATGTLGYQLRYFYPVYDQSGNQIGFVMVSTLMSNVLSIERSIIRNIIQYSFLVLLIGTSMSVIVAYKIKRSLIGYEPSEIVKLLTEREEIFDSLEEGIIAINIYGEIIFVNRSAKLLLNIGNIEDQNIDQIVPQFKLMNTIKTGKQVSNLNTTIDQNEILFSKLPIKEKTEVVGAVVVFRNRTEVKHLAQQLTGVNHFVDALRANNHEFMNKLHIILGLLELDSKDEAIKFITNLSDHQGIIVNTITKRIDNRSVAALLIGKISRGNELGINIKLLQNSYLPEKSKFLSTNSIVTILGNLIENSIEAINEEETDDKENEEITIYIYEDKNTLLITVDDSGVGMTEEVIAKIKKGRYSTKGKDRGTGMTLINNIIENCGGEMTIDSKKDIGTSIIININNKRF